MVCDKIKELREIAGYSQAQLARKLDVTRSSVNAWEMGLSTPTTQYIVALAKLFHVSSDYLLGLDSQMTITLTQYTQEEIEVLYSLIKYFDSKNSPILCSCAEDGATRVDLPIDTKIARALLWRFQLFSLN